MEVFRKFNVHDKAIAWQNSGGNLNIFNQPVGLLQCPYEECLYPDSLMKAGDYVSNDQQWVVVYCVPLDQDVIVYDANIEAIHAGCSKSRGDKVIHNR